MLVYEPVGNFIGKDMLLVLSLGLDELAGIEAYGTLNERCYNAARYALAIAHDSSLGLWCHVVDERESLIDVVQLAKQHVHLLKQRSALALVGNHGVNQAVVAFYNPAALVIECHVAAYRKVCSLYELVGYAAECRHHNNNTFICCSLLNNLLEAQYALHGTH